LGGFGAFLQILQFGDGAAVDGFYVALVHFYAWTKGFYQFPKIRGPWIKIVSRVHLLFRVILKEGRYSLTTMADCCLIEYPFTNITPDTM
jgi:hypothetical protein